MHLSIYLANDQLLSQTDTTQISVKRYSVLFLLWLLFHLFSFQSRNKMLQILQRFVFCPAMMVSNHQLDKLAIAGKCIFSILFPYYFLYSDQSLLPFLKSLFLNYSCISNDMEWFSYNGVCGICGLKRIKTFKRIPGLGYN